MIMRQDCWLDLMCDLPEWLDRKQNVNQVKQGELQVLQHIRPEGEAVATCQVSANPENEMDSNGFLKGCFVFLSSLSICTFSFFPTLHPPSP